MKIIINGCEGKMGTVVTQLASKNHEIVCGISNRTVSENSFPILDDINKFSGTADVLIDFSIASAIPNIIDYCVQKKLPTIICTTGIDSETEKKIADAAKVIPIFKSANMSIGVNLLNLILSRISQTLFDMNFDIEILEKHHNKKVDAPSGTALLFAQTIKKNIAQANLQFTSDRNHLRDKNEIGISCIRGGTIVGEHSVIFAGTNETIELKHCAQSREIFALGAIKAAEFILNKPCGLYSMNDLLDKLVV